MKRIVATYCLSVLFSLAAYPETSRIAINVYVPENASLSKESRDYLSDKVSRILSDNDILGKNYSDRFYLTAKVHVVDKHIIGGMPQRISQDLEITYKIGDAVDNIVYSTYSASYTGIGTNETKSQINAFSQIKSNNAYSSFIEEAKNRILEFYSERCGSIIQEAEISARNKEYDKAIYKLSLIPYGVDCYNNALSLMEKIYSEKMEYENLSLLSQAQQSWNGNPTKEGAKKAISYLGRMQPGESYQKQVQQLLDSMNAKLQKDEEREWQLMLKQYEHEQELKLQEEQNEADILNTCIQLGYDFLSSNFQPINLIGNILSW